MLKDLKFILNENVMQFDEEGNILPGRVSNVGYKFTFGSELYGSYMVICKPTVTAQDIMDCLEALCPEIEQLLNELTAADFVPKSEVEELKKDRYQILPDGKIELLPRSDVKALKKEVAWEIFEAIYKSVASKIPMEIRPIFKDDRDFDAGFINGKRDALLDVLVLVAELKKKYTEDNNDG